ncbi:hypothetical protein FKV24_004475 [Lysobacter maris]|uniref:Uncharacterized protein n=1 Tax=Marilutibacter maris TaxID=1605891 RepID=A0A508B1G5_9GAMM|nr:hypothetical protein [Lysobacter maris]KAB8196206.1 hypothetical protein FKV24_004475 [Lysobacter maris]
MKLIPIPAFAALALSACTLIGTAWSSDVCGCAPAWSSLAVDLGLQDVASAEALTLATVQAAADRYAGKPLHLADLPDTGSGKSCVTVSTGARCEWKLWHRPPSAKGYVAEFATDPTGRITSIRVSAHIWTPDSGT